MKMIFDNPATAICVCGDSGCAVPYGFCHCGCGSKASICKMTSKEYNVIAGFPNRFIQGHQRRIRPVIESAVPFKIEDVYCRLIPLGDGYYAIVDAADYEWLMQWKWYKAWSSTTKSYYVLRTAERVNRKRNRPLSMHRQIMGLGFGDDPQIDHKNNITLDNRRKNLRFADEFTQAYNRRLRFDNTSGFKGVCYRADKTGPNKWRARINVDGKRVLLGYFFTAEEAHMAYSKAALEYHKEFARLA